jgi:hypothetical protein
MFKNALSVQSSSMMSRGYQLGLGTPDLHTAWNSLTVSPRVNLSSISSGPAFDTRIVAPEAGVAKSSETALPTQRTPTEPSAREYAAEPVWAVVGATVDETGELVESEVDVTGCVVVGVDTVVAATVGVTIAVVGTILGRVVGGRVG